MGGVSSVIPGIEGWIIGVLLFTIGSLSGVIVWMQKRADKIYGYRLAERDTANAALNAAASAQQAQATASRERNQLQEELTETIIALSNNIGLFIERQTIHHTHFVADQAKMISVIDAIAAAMREAAMQSTGVKDKVDTLLLQIPGMTREIRDNIKEMVEDVQNAAARRSKV